MTFIKKYYRQCKTWIKSHLSSNRLWFRLVIILFSIIGISAGVVLVGQKQLLYKSAAVHNATITLNPTSASVQRGETFNISVIINTAGQSVVGTDVELNFNTQFLTLEDISVYPGSSSLKTFEPANSNGQFNLPLVLSRANSTGLVGFGAFSFDMATSTSTGSFNGVINPLANLTFRVKQDAPLGTTQITQNYVSDAKTDDENILVNPVTNGSVEDILQPPITSVSVAISEVATITPSPVPSLTLTPSPYPTFTVTPSPAPTSAPTLTPVPTVTPGPIPPTSGLLQNGSFEIDLSSWRLGTVNNARATNFRDTTTSADGVASAQINVTQPESWLGAVQFVQDNIPLIAGQTYNLTFWAKSSITRPIEVVFRKGSSPWTRYNVLSQNITTNWTRYNLSFIASQSDQLSTIELSLGQFASRVWLDGLVLSQENLINNPSFESNLEGWKLGTVGFAQANLIQDVGTSADGSISAKVSITFPQTWLGAVQFVQGGIPQESGKNYTLRFWAKSTRSRQIGIGLRRGSFPWTSYNRFNRNIDIGWTEYSIPYTALTTDSNSTLEFSLGRYTSDVWIDNVRLIRE